MSQPSEQSTSRYFALLALGSNATSHGFDRQSTLKAAIDALSDTTCQIIAKSAVYETPAYPDPNDLAFLNAVVKVETQLDASCVLDLCHSAETKLGRVRDTRWGARNIDIDLLAYGGADMAEVLPDAATYETWRDLDPAGQMDRAPDRMIVPHPRLQDRSFVLVPLADIAPDWRHPVGGLTTVEMLAVRPADEKAVIIPTNHRI